MCHWPNRGVLVVEDPQRPEQADILIYGCNLAASEAGETPVAEASSEPAEPGPEAVVEEDPAIEASADEEFTPGDEISEDYPIPLPSDI